KQGTRIPHEHLGRVPVVEQVGNEAAHQSRRQQSQVVALHAERGGGEEHHYRDGDAGGKAVDAVGEVHRIDAAHHHEHGKEDVKEGMNLEPHIHEGDVQVTGKDALLVKQIQENG